MLGESLWHPLYKFIIIIMKLCIRNKSNNLQLNISKDFYCYCTLQWAGYNNMIIKYKDCSTVCTYIALINCIDEIIIAHILEIKYNNFIMLIFFKLFYRYIRIAGNQYRYPYQFVVSGKLLFKSITELH